jgi:BNR repeat-like domain
MHAASTRTQSARNAVSCLFLGLAVSACKPASDRVAREIRPAPAASHANAAGDKPRITGGPQPAVAVTSAQSVASGLTPFTNGCDGVVANGTLYPSAEVEPFLAVDPLDANTMVGVWQQDRWSNGSARGLVSATTRDGGRSWRRTPLPFSRCGGGNLMNGGDYVRASDPWVTYSPNGVVHAMSLSTSGSTNAMLVSRSFDDGLSWTSAIALIVDGVGAFNDKNALTADPHDANYVYAVWDRLIDANDTGPTYFSRSTDGGASWETARSIYDPGTRNQTIGNQIAVLSSGVLINVFNRIDHPLGGQLSSRVTVMRSLDRGATWSGPIHVADLLATGTRDPETGAAVREGSIIPAIAAGPSGDVYVVWQDSRFNGGGFDGIAISRSIDGGLSWTAPTRVNAAAVPAFTPSVHVNRDGVVGVTYYDLRSNTAAASLSTDYWLARSGNQGATWTEVRVAEPFDMTTAPIANGMFVGDYHGLVSADGRFVPFYGRANTGDFVNRTDIVAAPLADTAFPPAPKTHAAMLAELRARQVPPQFRITKALRQRVAANLQRRMKQPPGFGSGWTMPNVMGALQQ